jgi:cell division protein FtsB
MPHLSHPSWFRREIRLDNLLILIGMMASALVFAMTTYHRVATTEEMVAAHELRLKNLEDSQTEMNREMTKLIQQMEDMNKRFSPDNQ